AQLTANTLAQVRYQTQSPDQGQRQCRFKALATPTSVLTATQQSLLSRLLQQYGSPSATSERALLSELEALEDVQVWNAFLDTVAAISTARGKRVLLKNLHHQNTEVITTVIGHSDPLISDPRYDQSLWRLLVSPNYPKPARLALAYKLGQQDAQRVIALLPEMEKTR
ncbi:MAG: hypothetical protein O7F73_13110, partial [Gammaproteobacteria bacterium]|nr:hypothetical protein [Gammaproteobacteria bacterium]